MSKTICPITRSEFAAAAKAVECMLGGNAVLADVKEFSTGSLGWFHNGKTVLKVGDKSVTVQVGLNVTVIGSKDLPKTK